MVNIFLKQTGNKAIGKDLTALKSQYNKWKHQLELTENDFVSALVVECDLDGNNNDNDNSDGKGVVNLQDVHTSEVHL